MASLWQKTLYYLGLVDEEHDEQPAGEAQPEAVSTAPLPEYRSRPRHETMRTPGQFAVPGERVEPPPRSRRRISADPSLAEAGVYPYEDDQVVRAAPATVETEIVQANAFSDAQLLADLLKERTPVVLDLRSTEPEMVRRLVDFASGLVYAVDGSMRKVAQGVILVTPARVTVSRDERRRLAGLGLYQAADIG